MLFYNLKLHLMSSNSINDINLLLLATKFHREVLIFKYFVHGFKFEFLIFILGNLNNKSIKKRCPFIKTEQKSIVFFYLKCI